MPLALVCVARPQACAFSPHSFFYLQQLASTCGSIFWYGLSKVNGNVDNGLWIWDDEMPSSLQLLYKGLGMEMRRRLAGHVS
jgi:hypothetical protein